METHDEGGAVLHSRFPLVLLPVLLLAPAGSAAQTSPLWQGLEPGPHSVGWRVEPVVDTDRRFACEPGSDDPGRPLRLFVWYPAADAVAPPLRFGDYVEGSEDDADPYESALEARDRATVHRQFAPPDSSRTEALLDVPVRARAGVAVAPGAHPVVVHVLGRNDYQQEATVLWEHLASHGYVVVVPPQMGPCAEEARLGFDAASIRVQSADVGTALEAAAAWPWADVSRAAVIGHSSGAMVAFDVADDDPRIAAIVSLDGSIATGEGAELARSMGLGVVDVPLLDLHAAGNPGRDTTVLDSLSAGTLGRWTFGSGEPPRQATHFDFQNWPLYATWAGVEDERGAPFRPAEFGRDVWLAAIRLTRAFLDDALAANSTLEEWRADPPSWLAEVAPLPRPEAGTIPR